MPANTFVAGLVIAGGRSTRFSGEKAVASLAGKPLLLWAAERLQGACTVVAVNARSGTQAAVLAQSAGFPVLHDAPGDPDGPLSGVKAGLAWAKCLGARSLAVSPCDAPLLPQDLFQRLIAAAGEGAALAETEAGLQPLCAVWPVAALERVVAALAGGAHPPTWRLLEELRALRVRFSAAENFVNLNTRDELHRLDTQLTSDRSLP
jgi:molybdopterin-guanine dinucleotide biosynthesis protein A